MKINKNIKLILIIATTFLFIISTISYFVWFPKRNNIEFKIEQKICISNLDVLAESIVNQLDLNDNKITLFGISELEFNQNKELTKINIEFIACYSNINIHYQLQKDNENYILINIGKINESYKYHSLREFFYYLSKVDTETKKVKFMVSWDTQNITYSSTLNQYFFSSNQYIEINDNFDGEYIKIIRLDYSRSGNSVESKEYFYKKN